jgi:hypothetical protein
MPRTTIGHTLADWIKLTNLATPEALPDEPHFLLLRAKLVASTEELKRLIVERNDLEARKQEATRRINELQETGRIQANTLRAWLRHELGKSNDRLAAFGIKVFRGRKRSRKAPVSIAASAVGQGEADPSASGSAAE